MEALKRKPDFTTGRIMELRDGTKIEAIGITARRSMEIANNKSLTDAQRGMHIIAAKILVNGAPIVADDLLDCFTDDEVTEIAEFVTGKDAGDDEKNGQ